MTAPPPDPSSSNPREFEAWEEISELNPQLMRGIYGYGFEKPSPIQQKSILSIMDGRDIIAQAQSGSGKTGAFATGALSRVRLDVKQPQALIIAPTRELASQIYDVVKDLGTQMTGLGVQLLKPRAVLPFDEHTHGAIGKLEQLQDARDDADVIQIVAIGIVATRIKLGEQEDILVTGHRRFKRGDRLLAANEKRHDHAGKHDDVAQGKQGK